MIAYASRTGTKRNLDALREHGWRLLVSARGSLRHEGFPYALDNGAWTAFQNGESFDVDAFDKALSIMGADADWIALPDIVGGGMASLELSLSWLGRVQDVNAQVLLPVQDGMDSDAVRAHLGDSVGIFLGGSTAWKLATAHLWGALAAEVGCRFHFARVNTRRRLGIAASVGASSFDGTSATRFSVNAAKITAWRDHMDHELFSVADPTKNDYGRNLARKREAKALHTELRKLERQRREAKAMLLDDEKVVEIQKAIDQVERAIKDLEREAVEQAWA